MMFIYDGYIRRKFTGCSLSMKETHKLLIDHDNIFYGKRDVVTVNDDHTPTALNEFRDST